ncbi:hypothetical protein T09_6125 [Trichinella sp. T9]|nr:hypothetical protein T09_6125 [Trichinella sp. T9]
MFSFNRSCGSTRRVCKTISYFILILLQSSEIGLNLKVARDILKVAIEAFLWDEEFLLIIVTDAEFVAWISLNLNWYWRRPSLR